ncbi:MAG: leucine--tRNA ligase [Planctomycetota bacterium]
MTADNRYRPQEIEPRWQARWAEAGVYRAQNPGDPGFDPEAPKYYVLDMFPYPSGAGLHVGHPLGYIGSDLVARRKRMEGFNVLHPMGYDAFGLPAEQYAIAHGVHPAVSTAENIATYRRQLQRLGLSFDWSRELATSDPKYYRWTQWIFTRLFDRGLAYRTEVPVWWCEELKTVLANEEVIDGLSERGGHPCVRRPLKQWMLKITEYAERLLHDLDSVDWPESVKTMQREWIGRSEGAEIQFPIEGVPGALSVFTTRPDTLFGATFMVIAPEHPLTAEITCESDRPAVEAYVREAAKKSDLQRTDLAKEKSGVFTGRYARNPMADPEDTEARLPIFVADYVLASYGTGAIMCVPAHDERDFEFAQRFNLTIREVVEPPEGEAGLDDGVCYTGPGTAIQSGPLDGLPTDEANEKAIALLEELGMGRRKVTYRLRDWLFSRQRYWGEPFPILHGEDGTTVRVPDEDLPVELPPMQDFTPSEDGSAPLARATEWVESTLPGSDEPARRDTDTMPGWAGSCWYYLRFLDPWNDQAPFAPEAAKYWGQVDLYIGGVEHAVLHLLYARFWHKVLYDEGLVPHPEPFRRLFNQGMLTAFSYRTPDGRLVPTDEVEERDAQYVHTDTGEVLEPVIAKMSKSLKNVVNPDDVCAEFGVDAFRVYEMFLGPLGESKPWDTRTVPGSRRFLDRVWRLFVDETKNDPIRPHVTEAGDAASGDGLALMRELHRATKRIDDSFQHFNFNTGVAALMTFVNEASKKHAAFARPHAERLLALLAPFAPHLAEELWERLGNEFTVTNIPWPAVDPAMLEDDTFELVVQVNGKLRARVEAPRGASKSSLEALAREAAADKLVGTTVRKTIVVPGKLVNFVVG